MTTFIENYKHSTACIKYPVQIDTSVCLVFLLEKCTCPIFSVSSTSGFKTILQTNQMQKHLIWVKWVFWTGLRRKHEQILFKKNKLKWSGSIFIKHPKRGDFFLPHPKCLKWTCFFFFGPFSCRNKSAFPEGGEWWHQDHLNHYCSKGTFIFSLYDHLTEKLIQWLSA